MQCASLGDETRKCWTDIPNHFPFVHLDAFVVMPDHMHGIIVIDKVERDTPGANKFGPQSKNLPSITRGVKIGVTKFARQQGLDFAWQRRYHDHIIRSDDELNRIRLYIANNPSRWNKDDSDDIAEF